MRKKETEEERKLDGERGTVVYYLGDAEGHGHKTYVVALPSGVKKLQRENLRPITESHASLGSRKLPDGTLSLFR